MSLRKHVLRQAFRKPREASPNSCVVDAQPMIAAASAWDSLTPALTRRPTMLKHALAILMKTAVPAMASDNVLSSHVGDRGTELLS